MKLVIKPSAILAAVVALGVGLMPATAGPIRDAIKKRAAENREERRLGLQLYKFQHDGRERSFYVYEPDNFDRSSGAAVLVFHGGEGNGADIAQRNNMPSRADSGGFLVVYPNAYDTQWNDGRETTRTGIDDVGFVRSLVAVLQRDWGVSSKRTFAMGVSNGGIFTQRLACDATTTFGAFVSIVANMPTQLANSCSPARAAPIVLFNGTADRLMPFEGGNIKQSKLLGKGVGGAVMSSNATAEFWASKNGCSNYSEAQLDDRYNDGTTVKRRTYSGCRAPVSYFVIDGAGHNWPGGSTRENFITGEVSKEVDANAVALNLFDQYGL